MEDGETQSWVTSLKASSSVELMLSHCPSQMDNSNF